VTRLRRAAATSVAAVLLFSLAGCGGNSNGETEKDKDAKEGFSAAADLTTCSKDAKPAPTPYGAGFPQDWPFPPQTTVFNVEDRGAAGTIASAVTRTPFKQVLAFMNKDVVGAGFKTESGETEEHDAEAEWDGKGYRGRWAIRESGSCPGETVVQVVSVKAG
jgi:hypothetical protein